MGATVSEYLVALGFENPLQDFKENSQRIHDELLESTMQLVFQQMRINFNVSDDVQLDFSYSLQDHFSDQFCEMLLFFRAYSTPSCTFSGAEDLRNHCTSFHV